MEATKRLLEALKELKKAELKEFIWHLCNGVAADIEPIPRGNLEEADRQDVVDCMVEQYSDDAGKITVQVLRNIKQNNLANHLESKLQEVRQPVQEDTRHALVPVEPQPIQSDGKRRSMTQSSQEFKRKKLQEMGDEIYIPAKSQRKGSALLITNIVFDYEVNNRPGAEIDEENMEWLLRALGYNVEKRRNLSGEAIDREVRNFSKLLSGHRDADSTFVVIMSHGARINNKDAILGVHYHLSRNPNDVYFVDETFSHLNSVNCPALIDKPKVILINACRGDHPGGVEVPDQVPRPDTWVHWKTDFVCFMSTVPDTASYRNTKTGSHFINYILDVFCECAHEDDLMELFRKVTNCMATRPGRTFDKLLPCLERTSLTKKFYLFPGL
ncbi:caspase-1-B-like [Sinocyclocheilus rhinocerous]|uniref:caspase-1-B-like n=1 Tax=Sinocyclocheilus rhinocerous TaxID=307959 RepID=UPI0007BA92D0|nr:PREDICTED: caspase-1-B-like [Sinocyclocheilus rhinocerous]